MAFLWLRSRANQKPHKAHSASTRRALSAKRERHGRGACEFPLSPVGFRTPTAANPDTETQEGLCCDVLLCLQGARPRGARASRRLLATGCAGGGRPNVRTRGARCILTTRRDGADRARRDGVDHARRDGADRARRDGDRRGNGQQPRGRGPRGAIAIAGPLGSVPGRA